MLVGVPLSAQTAAPDASSDGSAQPQPANAVPNSAQNAASSKRLLFALPNFQTVDDTGTLPPLNAGQKFKLAARGAFDYVQIPWYAMLAGFGQAENSEPAYGQGGVGYARRFASDLGDGVTENFMVGAVLPSLLHQDPRFYRTSEGGFMHRLGYALSRIVVTRSDSGAEQFNYSEILGSAMTAGMVTYAYHPREDRNLSNIASVWVTQLGYDALTYVTREFWPDLRRKIVRKQESASAGQ